MLRTEDSLSYLRSLETSWKRLLNNSMEEPQSSARKDGKDIWIPTVMPARRRYIEGCSYIRFIWIYNFSNYSLPISIPVTAPNLSIFASSEKMEPWRRSNSPEPAQCPACIMGSNCRNVDSANASRLQKQMAQTAVERQLQWTGEAVSKPNPQLREKP
jgi:hypothetical protein